MIVEYCDDSVGVGDYLISTGQSLWVELKAGTLAYTLEVFYETLEIEGETPNVHYTSYRSLFDFAQK